MPEISADNNAKYSSLSFKLYKFESFLSLYKDEIIADFIFI